MSACDNCGQPRIEGKKFCTRCGTPFPDEAAPSAGHAPPVVSRPPYRAIALGTASAVALAGIGIGAWFLVMHFGSQANERNPQAVGVARAPEGIDSPVATRSPLPSSTAVASPAVVSRGPSSISPSAGTPSPLRVAIAPAAGASLAAPKIAAFLDQYFTAINTHDYQAYVALLSPQAQGITQSQFNAGYGSTTDMAETLSGVSSAANGDSVAHVTFTSHQSAADSVTNSTCTVWSISLYLTPNAGGYLIDNPPSGYHAVYMACG